MKPVSEFEKTVGMTYQEAKKYLKDVGEWEKYKQYSGYEITSIAKSHKDREEQNGSVIYIISKCLYDFIGIHTWQDSSVIRGNS